MAETRRSPETLSRKDPWNVFRSEEPTDSGPELPAPEMKRIGEILVDAGIISAEIRDRVIEEQKWNRVSFGTALLEMRAMNEKLFLRALSVQTSAPPASAAELASIPAGVLGLVQRRFVERNAILPFRKTGRSLHVAMAHPRDNPATKSVALLTGLTIVPHVAIEARLALAIETHYGIPASPHFKALARILDELAAPTPAPPAAPPPVPAAAPTGPVPPKTLTSPPRSRSLPVLARTLREARDVDQVAALLLEAMQGRLGAVALFRVRGDAVELWRSWPAVPGSSRHLSIPLAERSLFALLRDMSGVFAGPCPDTRANREILAAVGGDARQTVVVIPVNGREGTILFVVGGPRREVPTLDKRALGNLAKAAEAAFDRLARSGTSPVD